MSSGAARPALYRTSAWNPALQALGAWRQRNCQYNINPAPFQPLEGTNFREFCALARPWPYGIINTVVVLPKELPQEVALEPLDLAKRVVDILSAKFGADILLLDLSGLTIIADHFVIATGESTRQLDAMAQDLKQQLKEELSLSPLATEGTAESGWILMDYGGLVVHIFSEAQRERYRLEELWSQARTVLRMA
ncbi:MAG: ribosome silencing factor [Chloroflexi bacterium]|nr:ribosome silencing factor [Chloroflexota bacterium]